MYRIDVPARSKLVGDADLVIEMAGACTASTRTVLEEVTVPPVGVVPVTVPVFST